MTTWPPARRRRSPCARSRPRRGSLVWQSRRADLGRRRTLSAGGWPQCCSYSAREPSPRCRYQTCRPPPRRRQTAPWRAASGPAPCPTPSRALCAPSHRPQALATCPSCARARSAARGGAGRARRARDRSTSLPARSACSRAASRRRPATPWSPSRLPGDRRQCPLTCGSWWAVPQSRRRSPAPPSSSPRSASGSHRRRLWRPPAAAVPARGS
mmetsp:Transcript_41122/g.106351  ORF Transcript_41122/g.106351 Transcript_41122/m.106351 type:complete len:213 (+) Transcript_41122:440-1078(+)